MRAASALLLAFSLSLGYGTKAQTPPPAGTQEAESASPALDWDRDFDLILESRQGNDRQNAAKKAKVDTLESELARLRGEEKDLAARREIFTGNVAGEEALHEMARLEVGSPDRARDLLDSKLAEVRARITDMEVELKRARKGKG